MLRSFLRGCAHVSACEPPNRGRLGGSRREPFGGGEYAGREDRAQGELVDCTTLQIWNATEPISASPYSLPAPHFISGPFAAGRRYPRSDACALAWSDPT